MRLHTPLCWCQWTLWHCALQYLAFLHLAHRLRSAGSWGRCPHEAHAPPASMTPESSTCCISSGVGSLQPLERLTPGPGLGSRLHPMPAETARILTGDTRNSFQGVTMRFLHHRSVKKTCMPVRTRPPGCCSSTKPTSIEWGLCTLTEGSSSPKTTTDPPFTSSAYRSFQKGTLQLQKAVIKDKARANKWRLERSYLVVSTMAMNFIALLDRKKERKKEDAGRRLT